MAEHITMNLSFKVAPLLALRLKLAALIIRFGCWIAGGSVGRIEIDP